MGRVERVCDCAGWKTRGLRGARRARWLFGPGGIGLGCKQWRNALLQRSSGVVISENDILDAAQMHASVASLVVRKLLGTGKAEVPHTTV
jgi:hypothetical protein